MGEAIGIKLQPRDWKLLRGLFESRVMTLRHIAALYFPGTTDMAKKRVQRLKAHKPLIHKAQGEPLGIPTWGYLWGYPKSIKKRRHSAVGFALK